MPTGATSATVRRPYVAIPLGLVAGAGFVMVAGETLDNVGVPWPAIAVLCVAMAAASRRLLRSWPFAIAFAVAGLADLSRVGD